MSSGKKLIIGAVLGFLVVVLLITSATRPSSTALITYEAHLTGTVELRDDVFQRSYFLTFTPREPTLKEFNAVVSEFVRQTGIRNSHWRIDEVEYDFEFRRITIRYTVMAGRGTIRP